MPNETLNSFQAWLIRQRLYCERCTWLKRATMVRNLNGRDRVLCTEHASRLEAARRSEKKQLTQTTT